MQPTKNWTPNRLFRFSGLILFVLTFAGCCSVVTNSEDAKILRCPQLIHSRGIESYRMLLPSISLAQTGTNTLRIRDLPTYLAGQFNYALFIPYDGNSAKDVPWGVVKITIVFQNLDHTEFYRRTLALRVDPLGEPDDSNRWNVGWINKEDCPETNTSFDIVVTVEQPSRKLTDRITLAGFAFAHKP
jgi:hypothetical protein